MLFWGTQRFFEHLKEVLLKAPGLLGGPRKVKTHLQHLSLDIMSKYFNLHEWSPDILSVLSTAAERYHHYRFVINGGFTFIFVNKAVSVRMSEIKL